MASGRFTLITFDLDDTLWDVRPVLARAEQRVEQWMRIHCPDVPERFDRAALLELRKRLYRERPELQHRISALRIEAMRLALRESGHDDAAALRLAREAFAVFMEGRHDIEPFAAVDAALERLARDYVLGALTNGNADVFRLHIGRHFRFAVNAETLGASKPAPEAFHAALRAASASPEQALHVGDHHEHDIAGARRVGMTAVWFNPEGRAWEGEEEAPHAQFGSFTDLPALVARLEQGG